MTSKKTTSKIKRHDGRAPDGLRDMEAKIGVVKSAKGSAMFRIGKTIAVAAVRGPRKLHPKFLQDPERGRLRCFYNMLAFSGSGDRVRPGPSRRSKEINLVMENALNPSLDLSRFPSCAIDVFVNLIQTDAGTRCAAITAASMALADAGFEMKDLVSSVAVGTVNGNVVADLDKTEEDVEDAVDIPIAMMPNEEKITLLQLDGRVKKDDLNSAVELAKGVCKKIYEVQKTAIMEGYK
jgi:exosome complex component RRP41|tara:strand:- start:22027 stop:22737 length:711 start_codon:yes stop_codon:yes gene_type:complete